MISAEHPYYPIEMSAGDGLRRLVATGAKVTLAIRDKQWEVSAYLPKWKRMFTLHFAMTDDLEDLLEDCATTVENWILDEVARSEGEPQ